MLKTSFIMLAFYAAWILTCLFAWNKLSNNEYGFCYVAAICLIFMVLSYKLRLYLFDKTGV